MLTHALNVIIQCVSAMNVAQKVNDSCAFEIKVLAVAIVLLVQMVSMEVHMVVQNKTSNITSTHSIFSYIRIY